MKVLVVDDEKGIADFISEVLKDDVEIVKFYDSKEAYTEINDSYDIMITDYNMPGVDGLTLCRHMREISPKCFNIISTGTENHTDISDGSLNMVLKKPFSISKLMKIISTAKEQAC